MHAIKLAKIIIWFFMHIFMLLLIDFRIGVALEKIEQRRTLSRWTAENPQYIHISHMLAVEEKHKILQQLYDECSSREFLLHLRSRYSGRYGMVCHGLL